MPPLIVITHTVRDERLGRNVLVASHGIDECTGHAVTLPCVPPEELGAAFDPELGEYTLANEQLARERIR